MEDNTNNETSRAEAMNEHARTKEELRSLVLAALQAAAEGAALAPVGKGTFKLSDGTVVKRN
jgi:hypothetical protein